MSVCEKDSNSGRIAVTTEKYTHIAELATAVASHVFPQLGISLQEERARASIELVHDLTLVNGTCSIVHLIWMVVPIVIASDWRALLI